MWETWVRSLGQEDPLQKEMATTPVFLPAESHGWRSLVGNSPWGHKESDKTERLLSFSVSEQQASQLERIDTTHQRGKHTFLWSRIWAGNTSVNSRGDMCFCANTPSLFSLEDGTLAVSSQRSWISLSCWKESGLLGGHLISGLEQMCRLGKYTAWQKPKSHQMAPGHVRKTQGLTQTWSSSQRWGRCFKTDSNSS